MKKVAVIGAGMSGLSVAHFLKVKAEVTLFEKSKGVSGRIATRNSDPYFFDHGAQYFTARTEPFRTFIAPLVQNGQVVRWDARYVKFDRNQVVERKNWKELEPRYVGVPTMNTLGKTLSMGLMVTTETKIIKLIKTNQWYLEDDRGNRHGPYNWVVCTIPSPQARLLIPPTFKHYQMLQSIKMRACFSLMLGFKMPLSLAFEAAHVTHADLSWIAVNSHKPGRSSDYTLLVHSTEDYAETHFNDDCSKIIDEMTTQTSYIIGCDVTTANFKTLHAWRYANNARREQSPILMDPESNLAACGDWCLGGRVEGAFTAAYRLTKEMEAIL